MKTVLRYSIIAITLMALSTCKKYDEGGLVHQTSKHLFGGSKPGSSKKWILKLFEVDGIDSTALIENSSSYSITFKRIGKSELSYSAQTTLYNYYGYIDVTNKNFTLGLNLLRGDSAQCKMIDNQFLCQRNIFYPELSNYAQLWEIKKLCKTELIIESDFHVKKSYKIILKND